MKKFVTFMSDRKLICMSCSRVESLLSNRVWRGWTDPTGKIWTPPDPTRPDVWDSDISWPYPTRPASICHLPTHTAGRVMTLKNNCKICRVGPQSWSHVSVIYSLYSTWYSYSRLKSATLTLPYLTLPYHGTEWNPYTTYDSTGQAKRLHQTNRRNIFFILYLVFML